MGKESQVRIRPLGNSTTLLHHLDASRLTDGGVLYGRAAGQRIAQTIARELQTIARGSVLVVDLTKVRQASYAVLKEMFSVLDLLRTLKLAERYLLFYVDARNEDLLEAVEAAAVARGSMLPVIDRNGVWHNFGRLTKAERDTLEAVEASAGLTSKALQARFGLLASAASNRLRRLHHLRLIKREERVVPGSGGREFLYMPLVATTQPAGAHAARRSAKTTGRRSEKTGARGR